MTEEFNPADDDALVEMAAKMMAGAWGERWNCECSDKKPECDCGDALPEDRAYSSDDYLCRGDFRHGARAALAVYRAHDPLLREAREAIRAAVGLAERDVILVRPSDRGELMQALTQWNAVLSKMESRK